MPKVLVVGPAWVGDMVMAQALFRRLAAQRPRPEIHVLAPPATAPLTRRMPEVDRTWTLAIGHGELGLGRRWRLARELAAESIDEAIVLPRSFKAALTPFFAGIPKRRGERGEARFVLLNDAVSRASPDTRTVDAFLALAGPGGPMSPQERPQLAGADTGVRERFGIDDRARLVALCPGAEYGPAKRWPAEHFATLGRDLLADGIAVAVIGSPKDKEAAAPIAAVPGVRDLTGATSLLDAVDLLAGADAVVSNDSGLMHVAAAFDRPLVALYGSSSAARTPPLSDRAHVLALDLECRPCFARTCPLGHTNCLVQLAPARVLAAVRKALS